MNALMYQPNHKWRFPAALAAAAIIHVAAICFGTTQREAPPIASGFVGEPIIEFVPAEPISDSFQETDPLPLPPANDDFYVENTATPPPVRRQLTNVTPLVKQRPNIAPRGSVTDVTMAKSTGSAFLDNAAIVGFRRWRFKPGSVSSVTCPVTFTLSGASY